MAETFETFVAKERARLSEERKAVHAQQRELEKKLAAIDREFAAIQAYETAKTGKSARAAGSKSGGPRRGSKREGILAALADIPHGLSRGELLEKLGLKGNRSGEMSVGNALTALSKGGQVVRKAGKYVASMG